MNDKVTISLFELASKYPTDRKARVFLEKQRWHGRIRTCEASALVYDTRPVDHLGNVGMKFFWIVNEQ